MEPSEVEDAQDGNLTRPHCLCTLCAHAEGPNRPSPVKGLTTLTSEVQLQQERNLYQNATAYSKTVHQ